MNVGHVIVGLSRTKIMDLYRFYEFQVVILNSVKLNSAVINVSVQDDARKNVCS